MAYTAVGALITAAMAHAGASATKTAFAADIATLQTEIQTQVASYSEAVANDIERKLLELAADIATAIKDVT